MENIKIVGFNNLSLNCYLFIPTTKPKASIQIIHGMQEHAIRYKHFAEFLCSKGYIVLASDLRAHGKTAKNITKLGYSDGDLFSETVQDQLIISSYLNERFHVPVYIFGHSYGSFITQKLIQVNPLVKKYVVCGSADGDSILFKFGNIVASLSILLGLKTKKAKLIEDLGVKSYGKKFKNGNWLSRDDKVFEEYNKDKYCGGDFPVSFYKSMFKNLIPMNKGLKNIDKEKHILFIAGDADPVGNNAKQVRSLFNKFIKNGLNAELEIYNDCRHELLNELNKEDIYNDILSFYKQK